MTSTGTSKPGEPTSAEFRPEELPPVSPPSAGFIVQLFLIPALIVMAVVAVWALFGKLADSDSDWRTLTTELGSSNEHRRGRAALGLAQLIQSQNDRELPEGEIRLAENPLVVDALTDLFRKALAITSPSDEDQQQLEYLARTMGALELDTKTLPVLAEAMQDDRAQAVRQSALMAVALIAARGWEPVSQPDDPLVFPQPPASPTISDPAVLEQLKRAAQDPIPVIRQLAGFTLANVGGEDSLRQLQAMLLDGNRFARVNAAVGLAGNGSIEGAGELQSQLDAAMAPFDAAVMENATAQEIAVAVANYPSEQARVVSNCLRAVQQLWPKLPASRRDSLKPSIERIASDSPEPRIRLQAKELLRILASGPLATDTLSPDEQPQK